LEARRLTRPRASAHNQLQFRIGRLFVFLIAIMKNSALLRPMLLASLVTAVVTSACAQAPVAGASAPAGSAALLAAIKTEVGAAPCDAPQQCQSAALGARPCGGPDSYIPWSSKQSDPQRLASLLARYADARTAENRASNDASTCMMVTNPGATCQAARCTLRPVGMGGMPDSAS
jgi:hypothetical protein